MQYTQDRRNVHDAVQTRPGFSAQPLYHLVCRGYRQWHHQKECGHADKDESPLRNITDNASQIEELIEPDIGQQVQRSVEESEQANHSARFHQIINPKDFAQWRDRKRQQKKDQRQHARGSCEELQRIRAYFFEVKIPEEQGKGD